jgi:peptidoglycan/LPS O-acetylase OafA/YrhL
LSRYRPATYQAALDGLRGLSIAAVLLYHDDYLVPGGYLGVDIFFVLSGFLITSLLFEEWNSSGAISLKKFYLRRVLRLFPALAVLLLVGTAFALTFPSAPQSPHVLRGVGYSLIYMANWANARDPFLLGPLGHTWSLAVEEQFYLLWPIIFIFALKSVRGRWRLFWVVMALAGLSAGWRFWLAAHGCSAWRIYNGTDTRADSLLIGCAAAIAMSSGWFSDVVASSWTIRVAAIAGALLIGYLMTGTSLEWIGYARGMFLVVAVGVACMVVAILADRTSVVSRLLSTAPLVWLGRLSYSLYLWHLPLYGFLKPGRLALGIDSIRIMRVLAALVAALMSYFFIERPFLRLKSRIGRPGARPVP